MRPNISRARGWMQKSNIQLQREDEMVRVGEGEGEAIGMVQRPPPSAPMA